MDIYWIVLAYIAPCAIFIAIRWQLLQLKERKRNAKNCRPPDIKFIDLIKTKKIETMMTIHLSKLDDIDKTSCDSHNSHEKPNK